MAVSLIREIPRGLAAEVPMDGQVRVSVRADNQASGSIMREEVILGSLIQPGILTSAAYMLCGIDRFQLQDGGRTPGHTAD
ncbi:hypothetical protein AC579_8806 [Pseudocercospora musae]|uniref:Uncharacterized protein n=1 Tax=Pseudocercospora musae TaxID=113226 RepID=A0A139HAC8_9PEZI|nr:hypothetical protein AC579_8806 [Pseudocercospora musae]